MSIPPAAAPVAAPVETSVAQQARYVGLVTRAIAIVIDVAIIVIVAMVVGGCVALILAVIHHPRSLETLIAVVGGAVYILWTIGYFVSFWSGTGQTPGMRVMQIRVLTARGERVGVRRGLVRCAGLVLAALPLFAGFFSIPFDSRRRGLQDYLAHTVVVEAPQLSLAETRRARTRAGDDIARRSTPARGG